MELEMMEKELKISIEEWAGIIVFSMTMLLTLNFNLALPLTVFSYTFFALIKRALYYWKDNEPMFFEKVKRYGSYLIIIFTILYFFDIFLTNLAVNELKIAIETNGFMVWLWGTFGYRFGQFLHIIFFSSLILYSAKIFDKSFNYKRILVNFMFVLVGVILWLLAVINNIGVFYTTYCHI